MKNEVTSKEIASIAARILDDTSGIRHGSIQIVHRRDGEKIRETIADLSELKSVCASALTQAADKESKVKTPASFDEIRTAAKKSAKLAKLED